MLSTSQKKKLENRAFRMAFPGVTAQFPAFRPIQYVRRTGFGYTALNGVNGSPYGAKTAVYIDVSRQKFRIVESV